MIGFPDDAERVQERAVVNEDLIGFATRLIRIDKKTNETRSVVVRFVQTASLCGSDELMHSIWLTFSKSVAEGIEAHEST